MNTNSLNSLDQDDVDFDTDIDIDETNRIIDEYDSSSDSDQRTSDILDHIVQDEKKRQSPRAFYKSTPIIVVTATLLIGSSFLVYKQIGQEQPKSAASWNQVAQDSTIDNNNAVANPPINDINHTASKEVVMPKNSQESSPFKDTNYTQTEDETSSEVKLALNFKPNQRALESQQPTPSATQTIQSENKKILMINNNLNEQLHEKEKLLQSKEQTIAKLQNMLEDLHAEKVAAEQKAELANREQVTGMQVIDFAINSTVAVVKVERGTNQQVIALSKGELVRVGGDFLTVLEVNPSKSLVLIGEKYFINSTMSAYISPKREAHIETKNSVVNTATDSPKLRTEPTSDQLQPIKDWRIVTVATDLNFVVAESRTGLTMRLAVGTSLGPYGRVQSILRGGTVTFPNHILYHL